MIDVRNIARGGEKEDCRENVKNQDHEEKKLKLTKKLTLHYNKTKSPKLLEGFQSFYLREENYFAACLQ